MFQTILDDTRKNLIIALAGFKPVLKHIDNDFNFGNDDSFEASVYKIVIDNLDNLLPLFDTAKGVKYAILTLKPIYEFICVINTENRLKYGSELEKCLDDVLKASMEIIKIEFMLKVLNS